MGLVSMWFGKSCKAVTRFGFAGALSKWGQVLDSDLRVPAGKQRRNSSSNDISKQMSFASCCFLFAFSPAPSPHASTSHQGQCLW